MMQTIGSSTLALERDDANFCVGHAWTDAHDERVKPPGRRGWTGAGSAEALTDGESAETSGRGPVMEAAIRGIWHRHQHHHKKNA